MPDDAATTATADIAHLAAHAVDAAPAVPSRPRATVQLPPPAAEVRLKTRSDGTHTLVAAYGEVDLDAAPGWERDLAAALDDSVHGLVLDLRSLRFCDCAGLSALLRVRRAAQEAGKTMTITSAGPAVTRLLNLTRTAPLFTTAPAAFDPQDPESRPYLTATVPAPPPHPSRATSL
ncbi:STAS domain-containing protein [Streptomyces sp. NPDC006552]|uniref:STAS domain-containing protein n=1 Tax=Streptomyces sp. NPDC006552 TaxID=3157179 RepID=UPI0033B00A90